MADTASPIVPKFDGPVIDPAVSLIGYADQMGDRGGKRMMTDAESTKLGGVQAGAQVNTITSVAGRTGDVTVAKSDVGLGNADNTSDANKPLSTAQQTALNAKAPLASPVLTGTPTAPTAAPGTNTTQIATSAFVKAAIDALVNGAPGALDALNELAAAIGNDPNFATTTAASLGNRLRVDTAAQNLNDTQKQNAKVNLGLGNIDAQVAAFIAQLSLLPVHVEAIFDAVFAEADLDGGWVGRTSADGTRTYQKLEAFAVGPKLTAALQAALQAVLDLKAPLASPALTGTPTAPTPAAGTNTTQLATAAFVRSEVAASAGLTAFQQIVVPAMRQGRAPRFSPAAGHTLTRLDDGVTTAPTGHPTSIRWNAAGRFRWEGGFLRQAGGNDWSFMRTYNAGAYNSNLDQLVSNSSRFEFDYDAATIVFGFMGGGGPFRVLVDGNYIDADGGKIWTGTDYPADGQMHRYTLNLGSAGTVRRIMIDAYGSIQLHTIWTPAGAQLQAPADAARPRVYLEGTSLVEKGSGWVHMAQRLLNIDGWDCGVGATGICNPGPNPRDNAWNRKNWQHEQFAYAIHEGLINDGDDAVIGSSTTYASRFKLYLDQYRRILDAWATAQSARPWFATGYFPSTKADDAVQSIYWPMRDAMDQACGEFNQFAHFIDPFPSDGVVPGTSNATTPQSYYLNEDGTGGGDWTHLDSRGAPMWGRRRARQISDLIYGGRF